MSNLKHLSVDELRTEINSLVRGRTRLETEASDLDNRAKALVAEANRLVKKADELRWKAHNNYAQRETWARLYLAQKS